jgi:outer membrane protein assembly factor BamB
MPWRTAATYILMLFMACSVLACSSQPIVRPAKYTISYGQGTDTVHALTSDGSEVWHTDIPQDSESEITGVIAGKDLVYVVSAGKPSTTDSYAAVLRISNGKILWQSKPGLAILSLNEEGDMVYISRYLAKTTEKLRVSDGMPTQ